ncbi:DUF1853 family protein [Microbulbifer marinus]|uniref:DUF1853 domain-containing protein n=1 Tax=Microbulbifer marinus TaxID=658218 RepID=A0A1H4B9Z3_9GAMM|nr:DUF1853 family protein [Microbulbifer marinus]SEA44937.1 hypothetical protein SAMN05216562_3147 [Microbulbifer marinus]
MAIDSVKVQADHWANLLWALSAPDIVRGSGLPWLPAQRRTELVEYFSSENVSTRLASQLHDELQNADRHRSASRLGVYFENLWAFAFAHHPHYELLYRNLPLRAAGRTLGELDFVVRHRPTDHIEHWEVAVKFYLQVSGEYWVGPGLRDRLDIKLARMREHQLPLIRQPAARELLQRQNILINRQWALMPGRLFRPLDETGHLHATINPDTCHYWWGQLDEFLFHFGGQPLRWIRLPKRTWLADSGYRVSHSDSCDALAGKLREEEMHGPVCVAGMDTERELSRGFIVPDSWYDDALATI